ncbi:MAG: sulfatase family protein [Acidobacteriota bacterium]
MKKKRYLIATAASCLLAFSAATVHAQTPQVRYNLISIVTDDQANWSMGVYGNRDSRTPNMDRLAREGALFTNAFTVTPVCSPSRASFLTGRYGTQLGITDWITPQEARDGLGLPIGATTWPEVLQRHGYVTGLIGKWHLGELPQFHPTRRGYHHFLGFLDGGNEPMNPTLEVSGKKERLTGSLPDILTDDAMKFVEANRQKPFALSLHFRAPHLPYGPVPEEDSAPFKNLDPTIQKFKGNDDQQVQRLTREYYASVHSVDRNVGRLLAHLDKLGLAEKTIIVFTSDHGYNIGHHGLHTKGNAWWMAGGVTGPRRPNMFENSIRIPLLVRWPGVVKPGTVIHEVVGNLDTFATVLGMLGLPLPPNANQEGADFSPLLRGQKIAGWRDTFFAQFDVHHTGLAFMRMIRTADWKLVRHHFTDFLDELYDLKNDPGETKNLYNDPKYREVREQLQQRLTTWQQSINDPLLGKTMPHR